MKEECFHPYFTCINKIILKKSLNDSRNRVSNLHMSQFYLLPVYLYRSWYMGHLFSTYLFASCLHIKVDKCQKTKCQSSNIHKKISVLESLFNKVAGLQAFLRKTILKNICQRLLLQCNTSTNIMPKNF